MKNVLKCIVRTKLRLVYSYLNWWRIGSLSISLIGSETDLIGSEKIVHFHKDPVRSKSESKIAVSQAFRCEMCACMKELWIETMIGTIYLFIHINAGVVCAKHFNTVCKLKKRYVPHRIGGIRAWITSWSKHVQIYMFIDRMYFHIPLTCSCHCISIETMVKLITCWGDAETTSCVGRPICYRNVNWIYIFHRSTYNTILPKCHLYPHII